MKLNGVMALTCLLLIVGFGFLTAQAQSTADAVEAHVAKAKAAAGQDYTRIFENLCTAPAPQAAQQPQAAAAAYPPPASEWHGEPAKVFDNLYYVGSKPVAAWAITTSE